MNFDTFKIEKRNIKTVEYQALRKTTGWDMLDDSIVEKALKNDLFSLCIYDKEKLVGMGRVIGDGFIYFYIQDIIVIPEYQKKGVGKLIMENIEEYLSEATNNNSFIGLMAAVDVKDFYTKFDYQVAEGMQIVTPSMGTRSINLDLDI